MEKYHNLLVAGKVDICIFLHQLIFIIYTVKPVYKGHSSEHDNVAFMSSCPLYTGKNYMHYSLMGEMRLPFIDSDLLYKGAL